MYVIEFSPPMDGLEGNFNTFRMGLKYAKVLKPYDHVLLVDKPKSYAFGKAAVIEIITGSLEEMASLYAVQNHNQKHLPQEGAADRLIESMRKRYGPHILKLNSKVTVLFLHRFA